ncbi:MAG: hypothetical protein JWP01_2243 [Myxococcales bacterium]|nr:hypothetical protein [Myxococcales bacterium]
MAKKGHRPKKKAAPAPASERADGSPPRSELAKAHANKSRAHAPTELVREPAFWFGFEVSWAKLSFARLVIFALLALDALLQISHAPRYGAGGFNVGQLPGLDTIGPGRVGFEIGQLLCAYLFVYAALGVATRFVIPAAAAIYAWLYFGSQLDSYQHHYLVALVLVIACFVPWERKPETVPGTPIRAWAVRLLLVQLGILYLWAAISKMSPAWLDGRTITGQITGSLRSAIEGSVGFKAAARFALLTELILAVTVWVRPAWIVALPVGIAFHIGILASGLDIGLFAYLMLAFYVFLVPDRLVVWIAESLPLRVIRGALRRIRLERPVAQTIVTGFALAISVALARFCRFDHAFVLAAVLCAIPIVLLAAAHLVAAPGSTLRRSVAAAGLAHLLAIGVWLVVDRSTTTAVDYFRFWGGNARRLGDPVSAEVAYRRLIQIAPDEPAGYFQLGRLLLARGEEVAGLEALHEAQRLEPLAARAWLAEAQWLVGKGRKAEAIQKAQEAVYSEPTNQAARDLLDTLSGTRSAPAAPVDPARPPARDDDADKPDKP